LKMPGPSKCPGCGNTVYAHDKPIKACGGEWHALCLKCTQCSCLLNLSSLLSYNNQPYCKVHIPKDKPTVVAPPGRGVSAKGAYMGAPATKGGIKTVTSGANQGLPQRVATPLTRVSGNSRGPSTQGAGPPMQGSSPARSWKMGTENPPSMGPSKGAPAKSTGQPLANKAPPNRAPNKGPTPGRSGPPPNRSGGEKKWNMDSSNTVPYSGTTFKSSSDPSKAAENVTYQSVSKTPFKPEIKHKTEVRALNSVQGRQEGMNKQTNVGKQPVGIMYSSSDSDDDEREQLRNNFKKSNYHGRGQEDQSTENNPNPSTIQYEKPNSNQSTENNPMQSAISYDSHNFDQSTENNPTPSAFQNQRTQQPTNFPPKKTFQPPVQDQPEETYVEASGEIEYTEQTYEETTYNEGGNAESSEYVEAEGGEYAEGGYAEGGEYTEGGYGGESEYVEGGEYTEGYGEGEYAEGGYGEGEYDGGGYTEEVEGAYQ